MNQVIDVCHLTCPHNINAVKKKLALMVRGDLLTVLFRDEITLIDFKSLCDIKGYRILSKKSCDEYYEIQIAL